MAKKKRYSIKKVEGTPHHELVLDKDLELTVPKRAKYLFSDAGKAKKYFEEHIKPVIKNRA